MAVALPPARPEHAEGLQSKVFTPPHVEPSDWVKFRQVGRGSWMPAIVMAVEASGLRLWVVAGGRFVEHKAVLHERDPRQSDITRQRQGAWDITDRERENRQRYDAVCEQLQAMTGELNDLKKKRKGPDGRDG